MPEPKRGRGRDGTVCVRAVPRRSYTELAGFATGYDEGRADQERREDAGAQYGDGREGGGEDGGSRDGRKDVGLGGQLAARRCSSHTQAIKTR